ncbi:MAG: RNA methyltransferase [Methylobacteriaceae bacterium]|nr:RNA methyltransferase [Methylobacteriaceae bacterium]
MSEERREAGPVIVLVAPQLGENIGMAARAMANFGLRELRIVAPRDGWPNPAADAASAGAVHVLEAATLHATTAEAVGDLAFVLATTARARGQMKRVYGPADAVPELRQRAGEGQRVGILFGPERTGLENDDVALADGILTFPVEPRFASLNLAQAVLLVAYEWGRGGPLPFAAEPGTPPAPRVALLSMFDYLEAALDQAGFYPPDKRPPMARNMRDMFLRMDMTEQDVRTLRGAIRALVEGRMRRKA